MIVESLREEAVSGVFTLNTACGVSFLVDVFYLEGGEEAPALLDWGPGRELSAEDEEALRFAARCGEAEKKALGLIAGAEQTRRGLARKLELRGYEGPCAAAVVSRLVDMGMVDDERYGELWLRGRLARGGGKAPSPRSLQAALENRGLDRETAEAALEKALDAGAEEALMERFVEQNSFPEDAGGSFIRNRLKAEGFSFDAIHSRFS